MILALWRFARNVRDGDSRWSPNGTVRQSWRQPPVARQRAYIVHKRIEQQVCVFVDQGKQGSAWQCGTARLNVAKTVRKLKHF